MTHHWDEFSKSLAEEAVPRRESLRRLGVVFAGAVLSPLGLETAWARGPDPCKSFCRCRNKQQQKACLAACNACNNDPRRVCGTSCGSYVCCPSSLTCCGEYCADLDADVYNCGGCGNVCDQPGPYEYGACINGGCEYACAEGAVRCNGTCTYLGSDPYNCGACGNVCGGPNPSCYQGACSQCTPYCPEGWCGGDGCGGECACPSGMYCESNGWCYADYCPPGTALCGGQCISILWDPDNCGACGNVCAGNTPYCNVGTCGQIRCFGGQALCGGVCREISLDPSNCGGCGVVCGPGENCAGGLCQSAEPPG